MMHAMEESERRGPPGVGVVLGRISRRSTRAVALAQENTLRGFLNAERASHTREHRTGPFQVATLAARENLQP